MRKNRSIRNRVRRSKKTDMEVDITSLLDILVILLVFLLKSYSSSGLVFNVQEGINLPYSESLTINTPGVIIQVSPDKVLVDDELILDSANQPAQIFDQGGRRLIPLFNELVRKRETSKLISKTASPEQEFSGVVNFVIDKTIGYNYVKKLMYTAGEAGYFKFNFVVLGEES